MWNRIALHHITYWNKTFRKHENMGQQEIFGFLRKHPDDWFDVVQIQKALGLNKGNVFRALKVLRKNREVQIKGTGTTGNSFLYRAKIPLTVSDESRSPATIENHGVQPTSKFGKILIALREMGGTATTDEVRFWVKERYNRGLTPQEVTAILRTNTAYFERIESIEAEKTDIWALKT